MKKRKIEIFRLNPPSKGIFIRQRISHPRLGEAWVEKEVNAKTGLLTPNEAATFLKITLRRLYQLIEQGKLKPVRRGNWIQIRLRDLLKYEQVRRKPGRPHREREAFLI